MVLYFDKKKRKAVRVFSVRSLVVPAALPPIAQRTLTSSKAHKDVFFSEKYFGSSVSKKVSKSASKAGCRFRLANGPAFSP